MLGKVIKDCIVLTGVGVALVAGWTHRPQIYEFLGLPTPADVQAMAAAQEPVNVLPMIDAQTATGSTVTLYKARDGHFWAEARVNKGFVKFLVDTGASAVALTPDDAKKAGLSLKGLKYNAPVMTANGQTMAARVTLDSVTIGGVSVKNVSALIVSEGLTVSLLGMTFLGEMQKVEATRDTMLLRQ